jgi:6-phosphogluconolactonase
VAQQMIAAAANISIGKRGFFRIALSGGQTPRLVYAALAQGENLNWERWQIFWSDERCVPPTSPESNYRLVKETLLDPLLAAPGPAHGGAHGWRGRPRRGRRRLRTRDSRECAGQPPFGRRQYCRALICCCSVSALTATRPASFHIRRACTSTERLVVANPVAALGTTRLTFTFPLINAARRVLLLVNGATKAAALAAILAGPPDPQRLPSQSIRPLDGVLTWLVDEPASSQLGGGDPPPDR